MKRIARAALACALLAAFAAPAARAERIIRINDNVAPGFFSQPSIVEDGLFAHVAFIGADNATGPFRLYYAAVRLNVDFTILSLTRAGVVAISPVVVADTLGSPASAYADARHPKIALRSTGRPVIFFQARPSSAADNAFVLYRALIAVDNLAVTSQAVTQVGGNLTPGDIEDVSYALIPADNSARLVYSNRSAIDAPEPFQVYYSRVGLDNALVVGNPLPLSLPYMAGGPRPLPNLRLDAQRQPHIAWSSAPAAGGAAIYYAMIKEVNRADNAVIPATLVMSRLGTKWGRPAVLPMSTGKVQVTAVDETAAGLPGEIGFVELTPANAKQDGNPVDLGQGGLNNFIDVPPGQAVLPGIKLFCPEISLDTSDRTHMTGLGGAGAFSQYVAFRPIVASPFYEIVTAPTSVGLDNNAFPAAPPAGDFTTAALLHLSTRNMIVWSGIDNVDARFSNLNVTTVPGLADPLPSNERGCSVSGGTARDDSAGAVRALAILLPAAALLLRRRMRLRRGRLGD